jgi:cytochrome P450
VNAPGPFTADQASILASRDVLRPPSRGLKAWFARRVVRLIPFAFRLMRRFKPIPKFGSFYIATRHDDVRELFATDTAFAVPYKAKLDVITGEQPFFLGMGDTPDYRSGLKAMQDVVRPDDLPALAQGAEQRAEALVEAAGGRIEVVGLVRDVTFGLLGDYFGVPEPAAGSLQTWATRLFEFQFADSGDSPELRAQVDVIAPRRSAGGMGGAWGDGGKDDVLARCLALQAASEPGYSDDEIRTALVCMMVGGPPQPPMVVPQALEQLLRRPAALTGAQDAARDGGDEALRGYVWEAMRFDPLAPGLPRVATRTWTLAQGTKRAREIPAGATVLAAFASAMMDERRVPDPRTFDPRRTPHQYIHFGHHLHECFGRHINGVTLHRMLKPLLRRDGLRRARGRDGRLSKNGPFAERLVVEWG